MAFAVWQEIKECVEGEQEEDDGAEEGAEIAAVREQAPAANAAVNAELRAGERQAGGHWGMDSVREVLCDAYKQISTAINSQSLAPIDDRQLLFRLVVPLCVFVCGVFVVAELSVQLLSIFCVPLYGGSMTIGELRRLCIITSWTAVIVALAVLTAAKPFKIWLQKLHDAIRDDRYLVGRQLHNRRPEHIEFAT